MSRASNLQLEECRRQADLASSLPPEYYTSPQIAEVEIDRIFRACWIGVGRSSMVENPGDYIALDVAGQSIILLRDTDGRLRVFANTCRHRGARLVDGAGTCKGLRCPFHSWFYTLDGRLVAAPHMERANAFDKHQFGLVSYAADEVDGFAFVNLSAEPPALEDALGDFSRIHTPWPLQTLVSARRQELLVDCNWKSFLEVFNEYYHLPFVHPDSIDSIYKAPEPADLVTGAYATQFGSTDGTGGLLETDQDKALPDMRGMDEQWANGARYTWIFPNMTFAANRDALWCYEAYPDGPDRCKVVQTACFPPETVSLPDFETRVTAYLERLDAALDEDIPALVNQHRGLCCPDSTPGRFQPDLEPNVASFANWYSRLWA